jgi:hypothetical protein
MTAGTSRNAGSNGAKPSMLVSSENTTTTPATILPQTVGKNRMLRRLRNGLPARAHHKDD